MNTIALPSDFFCAKPLIMVKFLPEEVNLQLLFLKELPGGEIPFPPLV